MVVPGSFGGVSSVPLLLGRQVDTIPSDIGGAIYGKWMRRAILFSIIISQLGFVAAYTIFVAENLQVSRFRSASWQMEFI